MAVDPKDTRHIFVGTKASGMFVSDNSGDAWRKIVYPPTKNYGLVVDANDSKHLFATGEWQGRGKIYQSTDGGDNWNEVYTEPANGTVLVALAQNPFNSQMIYAGTSTGAIIRTTDGGVTWQNSATLSSAMNGHIVRSIVFDTKQINTMYILVDGKGVYVSDGDKIITDPSASISIGSVVGKTVVSSSGAVSMALDPNRSGTAYIGSIKGVYRSTDFGKTWEALNIIESPKKAPTSAIAINPKDSNEIAYASALTLYKSLDGGVHWSTHPITSDKTVSLLQYDAYDPAILYVGFKQ